MRFSLSLRSPVVSWMAWRSLSLRLSFRMVDAAETVWGADDGVKIDDGVALGLLALTLLSERLTCEEKRRQGVEDSLEDSILVLMSPDMVVVVEFVGVNAKMRMRLSVDPSFCWCRYRRRRLLRK